MKKTFAIALALLTSLGTGAQGKPADTVIVELAKTSKVVFTIKERSDLELLKKYDFQALFSDILDKLEKKDTIQMVLLDTPNTETIVRVETNDTSRGDEDDDHERDDDIQREYRYRTRH
jgi:tRNA A37 threonylcarbamoyladenosine dehydratase